MFALQPQLDRIHRQHAVHRKVPSDVAQHVEVVQLRQPLRIVDHQGIFWPRTKAQELGENLLDAALVVLDIFKRQQFAAFVAPRRIAHPCRAAAHQGYGFLPQFLGPVQQHDLHQRADVEGLCRAVKTDISCNITLGRKRIEASRIGTLVNVAPG